jgi:hypothetical protein
VGREHGRTIPLADPGLHATHLYALTATC